MWEVVVDKDKCTGDEECVDACPAQVFEMVEGKSEPVNMDECLGCETCVEVCPEGAIIDSTILQRVLNLAHLPKTKGNIFKILKYHRLRRVADISYFV